jgi:hypothetical protein
MLRYQPASYSGTEIILEAQILEKVKKTFQLVEAFFCDFQTGLS